MNQPIRLVLRSPLALLVLPLLAGVLCAGACTGSKAATEATSAVVATDLASMSSIRGVSLSQGGCFGTCPVFTLSVKPDGTAAYTGKQYAPYKGLHNGRVDADTLARLLALGEEVLAKADQLPREIDTGIADHSYSTIVVTTATDTLEFVGTTEFAAPVEEIRALLSRATKLIDFTRDPSAEPELPNRLKLTLQSADQIQIVQEDYFRQQFKVLQTLSIEPATFLVQFDPYTMSAEEMVTSLQRKKPVVKVEIIGVDTEEEMPD